MLMYKFEQLLHSALKFMKIQNILIVDENLIWEKLFLDTALAIKAAPCWVINYGLLRKHQNSHIIITKRINQCCKLKMIR